MVERYRCYGWDIRRGEMRREDDGNYVLYSDYARLQEQVEALEARLAAAYRRKAECNDDANTERHLRLAAEAEEDRLRAALEKQDEADRLLEEGDDVAAMLAYADAKALRLAALQKEPQP